MLVVSLIAGICAAGVSLSPGILEALILFVGAFALITIGLLSQGILFMGLGYTVVYIGAITIVFVFAVLVMDSHQINLPRDLPSPYGVGAVLACMSVSPFFLEGSKLGHAPGPNPSLYTEELNFLGNLAYSGAVETLLSVGFILLFVMLGPVIVWA